MAVLTIAHTTAAKDFDMEASIEHGHATNNGVKIHYAATGQGPLIVMTTTSKSIPDRPIWNIPRLW